MQYTQYNMCSVHLHGNLIEMIQSVLQFPNPGFNSTEIYLVMSEISAGDRDGIQNRESIKSPPLPSAADGLGLSFP